MGGASPRNVKSNHLTQKTIMNRKRIIILGGGFAGTRCAEGLRRSSARNQVEIVLFNAENHLVFTPLLADVIGSSVNPLDVVVPLRQLLPGVHCRTEEILNIHAATNEVEYRGSDGRACRLGYDQLVLACGNVANLNSVRGMASYAFPLKSIGDAIVLRSHVMEQMERAEICENEDRRRWHLSFVVVGGGFSGVEAAGEINDLVRSSARYFQNFRVDDVRVTLIQAGGEILPEMAPSLRTFARQDMEKSGIRVLLRTPVAWATAEGVMLENGEMVSGGTIVCTVGTSPAPITERFEAGKVKGRLETQPDMRVKGFENIWAIGDCAQIINSHDQRPSPATAQFAERQGRQCARNILRALGGVETKAFHFKAWGQLCSIGGHSGVAELCGVRLSGFAAWVLWRLAYLYKLPSVARRLQLAFDWAWLIVFPRDLAHLRTREARRGSPPETERPMAA